MPGNKNALARTTIVSAGDMSQATVTSSVGKIEFLDNIGIQVNITAGTPSGAFDVQVSADHTEDNLGNVTNAGNWISLGSTYTSTITSGSPSNVYFDLYGLSSLFIRLLYTKSSGTGTFNAYLVGKSI